MGHAVPATLMTLESDLNVRRVKLTLLLLFFFGFPCAGIVYFWRDMHTKIEANSQAQGEQIAVRAMTADSAALKNISSPMFAEKPELAAFLDQRSGWGPFIKLENITTRKSWAGEREDRMWQFVRFNGTAQFKSGPKNLEWVVCRVYIDSNWMLDDMKLAQEGKK